MSPQIDVEADDLEALKAKAKALRKTGMTYDRIGVELNRTGPTIRRWLVRKAAKKQAKISRRYDRTEKGREARRRIEATRYAKRKAAAETHKRALGQMFD